MWPIDFGDGQVLLRRDEHAGAWWTRDGMLRIEMAGWALEHEPSQGPRPARPAWPDSGPNASESMSPMTGSLRRK